MRETNIKIECPDFGLSHMSPGQIKITCYWVEKCACLHDLCVFPDFRNHGVGSKLIKEAETYIKEHFKGIEVLELFVRYYDYNYTKTQHLINWYEKQGYERSWIKNGYIRMVKILKCDV